MPRDRYIPRIPGKEPDWGFLSRDIEAADFRRTPEAPFLPKSREAISSLIETIGGEGLRPYDLQIDDFLKEPITSPDDEGDIGDADAQIAMNKYFGGEPAMEPLGREDIFPGRVGARQVGTITGPIGATPIIVAGGALFPFEILNARKRALERGAAAAGKKKKEFITTWNKIVKFKETAPQYDQVARAQFIDWTNWRFNTLTEELGGNGMEAGAMLLDPTTKVGQEFLKDIELWNSFSRNLKDIGEQAVKIAKEVREGGTITKKRFKELQDFQTAAENPREFIDGGGDINKFRESFMIAGNLMDAYNKALVGVKGDVETALEYNRSLGGGNVLYESQVNTFFGDETLETLVDQIWTPAMEGAGVTKDEIRRGLKAKLEHYQQDVKVVKKSAQTRISIGDGKEREERMFTKLFGFTMGQFNADFDEIIGSNLTTKQKADKILKVWGEGHQLKSPTNKLAAWLPLTLDQTTKKYSTTASGTTFLYRDTGEQLNLRDYQARLKIKEETGTQLTEEEEAMKKLESDTGFNVFISRQRYETTIRDPKTGKEHIATAKELAENPELIDFIVPTTTIIYRGNYLHTDKKGNEKLFKLPPSQKTDYLDRTGSLRNANIRWRGIGTGGKIDEPTKMQFTID